MRSRGVTGETRTSRVASLAVTALLIGAGTAAAQTDPPVFAPVSVKGTQVVVMNVTCFDHEVGGHAPATCRGAVMFHDAAGRELHEGRYDLQPGQSTSVRLVVPATDADGQPVRRVLIIPCFLPDPGGLAVPSVEVFDREAGRIVRFDHPAAPRASAFVIDPGGEVGFDPQPEPPLFGMATLRGDQVMRMNVTCFPHAVGDVAPAPCRGTMMAHDASGNVLRRVAYDLLPGAARSFTVASPAVRPGALAGIVPCFMPEPGGLAVPNVEVTDGAGGVAVSMNPAAARATQFQLGGR